MKLSKENNKVSIELPEEIAKHFADEVELVSIENGAVLLIAKETLHETLKKTVLTSLLHKALNSKDVEEKTAIVQSTARTTAAATAAATEERRQFQPQHQYKREYRPQNDNGKLSTEDLVYLKGFIVIEDEMKAREASKAMEQAIAQGKIFGVRGFDKKFYIVSSDYYKQVGEQVQNLLQEGQKSLLELVTQVKASDQGCLSVLQVMKDKGEIIEKRKNQFEKV